MPSRQTSSEAILEQPDYSRWLDQHGDCLYRYALFRLRESSAAEAVVQHTLEQAHKAEQNLVSRTSERSWLLEILKHEVLDYCRRIFSILLDHSSDDEQSLDDDPFEKSGEWQGHWCEDLAPKEWDVDVSGVLESNQFWETLDRCLNQLPRRTAIALVLRDIDGLSLKEICKVLCLTSNEVCIQLHKARFKLRNTLEQEWFSKQPRRLSRSNNLTQTNTSTDSPVLQRVLRFVGIAA